MRSRLVLAAIVLLALAAAWMIRFGCDDAYISFVYARNLVRGDGLTWFGTYIEGYTNFAWVMWLSAGIAAGVDPLVWAWIGSLSALAVAIVASYQYARSRTNAIAAACVAGLLATNFTFLAFGTSGLETMLQTALLAVATWQVERLKTGATPRRLAWLSIVWGLAIWTRLDSAVICAVLGAVVAARLVRDKAGRRAWIAAIAPGAILVGGWLAWKLYYYGDLVPNTFHAKVGVTSATLLHGAAFVAMFLRAYALWAGVVLVLVIALVKKRFAARLPAAIVGAWFAYIIFVGGDFMEFRFFVPAMPALCCAIAEAVTAEAKSPKVPAPWLRAFATVAVLAAVSWRHAATFKGVAPDKSYDSIRALATFYNMLPGEDWDRPGTLIRDGLGADSGATLACNGAGAIPYYADFPTVDQLGLNDAWVAEHGKRPPETYVRPGHQRYATYDYLVAQQVTFVIGSPFQVRRGVLAGAQIDPQQLLTTFLGAAAQYVPSLDLVAMPLTDRTALLMWYLTPSPAMTKRIEAAGWERRVVKLQPAPR